MYVFCISVLQHFWFLGIAIHIMSYLNHIFCHHVISIFFYKELEMTCDTRYGKFVI